MRDVSRNRMHFGNIDNFWKRPHLGLSVKMSVRHLAVNPCHVLVTVIE
jgi:hypothetical protein